MINFAFVFPGQGSQSLGMLNGFFENKIVKETVEEASQILGQDLYGLMNQGPKEQLDLTTNTQPVMLTVGVACYRAWLATGAPAPKMVAGHSLGEYSALVAAGVITFKDALPLVRFRAQAMQEAVPVGQGSMAAILGLSDEDVRAVCLEAAHTDQIVEPVNFNAPLQVVIAGHKPAVDRACEIAKKKGAKRALVLPVSAPFHSSLLTSASLRLRLYMEPLHFNVPEISLVNNVDVSVLYNPDQIKDALVRQSANPVRWVETIQKMADEGITHIFECGPGKVLSGLTKRIQNELVSEVIADQISLEKNSVLFN